MGISVQVLGYFVLAAAASMAFCWFVMRHASRWKAKWLEPGAMVRFRTGEAMYRTRFTSARKKGLAFAAPLQRDVYVPIPVGERVIVEAPSKEGVIVFRTHVIGRDVETREIVLAVPEVVHREERREGARQDGGFSPIQVEDREAWLVDVAPHGVKFTTNAEVRSGERIKVEMPSAEAPAFAWVLEAAPNHRHEKGSKVVRARWENAFETA